MKTGILKEFLLLIKGNSETIQNEGKEQKGGILGMLLSTQDASLIGNMLEGKGGEGEDFYYCLSFS